jgi:hypothetical protein
MPADLTITAINPPPAIVGGCPTSISVEVKNVGDAPMWGVFHVCLSISSDPEAHDARFVDDLTVSIPEHDPLYPEDGFFSLFHTTMVRVVFDDVAFPCASPVWVRAVADCKLEVANSPRSAPELTVGPLQVDLTVPWLWTEILRVGTRDSAGSITWTPRVCSATTLVAEVAVTNRGCGRAAGSRGELYMIDGGGNQTIIGGFGVPSLAGGGQRRLMVTGPIPALPPGPQNFVLRACADIMGAVPVQCDLFHICSPDVPFYVGGGVGAPIVTVGVDSPIRPGQRPSVTWSIMNDCSDLADVTAGIEFAGVELYKSQPITVALLSSAGEQSQTVPRLLPVSAPAIANGLFMFGTKPLDLVLEATGPDKNLGPFTAQAPLTVIPEAMAGWWSWSAPAAGAVFPWKSPYTVSGTLTNRGSAGVTPTSISLREHDQRDSSTASDVTRNFSGSLVALVPGGSTGASWPTISPAYRWFETATMFPSGPYSVLYDYTVEFFAQDEFGNPYGPISSSMVTVVVRVEERKIAAATTCFINQIAAVALAALGAIALAGYITAVSAPVWFGLAGVAFAIAAAARLIAIDPPVPDFSYRERVSIAAEQLPDELRDLPRDLMPLRSMFELGSRLVTAATAMSAIEGKMIAAHLDGDMEAFDQQRSDFEEALAVVTRTGSALPPSGIESLRGFARLEIDREAIGRVLEEWRRDGMPAEVRERWPMESLPPEAVELFNSVPPEWVEPIREPEEVFEQAIAALISLAREAETAANRTHEGLSYSRRLPPSETAAES